MKKKILKIVLLSILIVLIIGIIIFIIWVNDIYKADSEAKSILENNENVVKEDDHVFIDSNSNEALVFYPGAKVEYIAYLPLLLNMSNELDIDIFLVKMPLNLAFFGVNKADDIIDNHDYDNWYISGHSLGGAMASKYAESNDKISKLILLGSYVYSDFPLENSLTIYGSLDHGLKELEYEQNVKVIEGGSHAEFGNYGEQKGYENATITNKEQQDITINYIKEFLNK